MAGIVKVNEVQLGDNADATKNFVLRTNADGSFTFARGNVGATTQDILKVAANGQISTLPRSYVRVNTNNGNGSTNTVIRRFLNLDTTVGTDITYVDSATLGASFTINADGIYAISYFDSFGAATDFGISRNSTQLTTAYNTINQSDRLGHVTLSAANLGIGISVTLPLVAGDVIRAHANGATGGTANRAFFFIVRVA